jgi:hypothetical protein
VLAGAGNRGLAGLIADAVQWIGRGRRRPSIGASVLQPSDP